MKVKIELVVDIPDDKIEEVTFYMSEDDVFKLSKAELERKLAETIIISEIDYYVKDMSVSLF